MTGADRGELAMAVIAAVNDRDAERLEPLLHPDVEVRTGRSVKSGKADTLVWAEKAYDHIDRRYAVAVARAQGDRILMVGEVEYVWREEGHVGDSTPIALELTFDGDLLSSLRVEDDQAAALNDFES